MTKESSNNEQTSSGNTPWLKRSTGFIIVGAASVVLAIYTGWQLYPSEGLGMAVVWGLGSAVGMWLVFGLSYLFNILVRPRRQ